jgi:HSP20 family protein
MNLARRDPFDLTFVPMSRLFNHLVGDGGDLSTFEEGTLPLDISEDEKNVIVRAAVPGFAPEDINVEVHNGVLTINAQHRQEHEEHHERFYRRELRFGSMSRRVALPSTVREDAVTADLNDGMLTLRIPKSEKAIPRKVQIRGKAPQGGGSTQPAGGPAQYGQSQSGIGQGGHPQTPGQRPTTGVNR